MQLSTLILTTIVNMMDVTSSYTIQEVQQQSNDTVVIGSWEVDTEFCIASTYFENENITHYMFSYSIHVDETNTPYTMFSIGVNPNYIEQNTPNTEYVVFDYSTRENPQPEYQEIINGAMMDNIFITTVDFSIIKTMTSVPYVTIHWQEENVVLEMDTSMVYDTTKYMINNCL